MIACRVVRHRNLETRWSGQATGSELEDRLG